MHVLNYLIINCGFSNLFCNFIY
uniref:Uncharacterized protein n=1 Tax=Arundo donax TaxID=35708 RepID=A0A0A8Y1J9_ARUDO